MSNQSSPSQRLTFFPEPYPGELLYSMVARYSFQHGFKSARSAHEELFGNRLARPNADLPFRLEQFAARLPLRFGLTAERLLQEHTLFPYYAAYADADTVESARAAAFGSEGGAAIWLGTKAMPVGHLTRLRFCRLCLEGAAKADRDPHWLRAHQIPIATFCTIHGVPLQISTVELGIQSPNIDMPTASTCPDDAPSLVSGGADVDALLSLSRDAVGLLEGVYPVRAPREVSPTLAAAFAAKDGVVGSRLNWSKLEAAIAPTLAGLAPAFPHVLEVGREQKGWLDFALRSARRTGVDAILLATHLLDRMPDPEPPSGTGPWPCLNPLAKHFGDPVVGQMEYHHVTHGKMRGRFTCRCGYVYSQSRLADGTMSKPFRMEFGPLLADHVLTASRAGVSVKEAAARAGMWHKAFIGIIREQGLAHEWDSALIQ